MATKQEAKQMTGREHFLEMLKSLDLEYAKENGYSEETSPFKTVLWHKDGDTDYEYGDFVFRFGQDGKLKEFYKEGD